MFTPHRNDLPPEACLVDMFFTTLDLEVLFCEEDDPARRAKSPQTETTSRQVEPVDLASSESADYELPPQSHPDEREVTVLSGVWFIAYGDTFDAAKLQALPAGSWYTEPADVPLYILTKEPTVIQVTGVGPSGRHFTELFIDP